MKRRLALPLITFAFVAVEVDADTVNARFPRDAPSAESVFMRMFPELPPFAPQTDAVRNAVKLLGARGGLLDARDNLSDPMLSITDPAFSPTNLNNPAMTAGLTFLGQFLDHDVTLDLRSRLLERAEPRRTANFRSAAFDLDSLYGDGPERSPELYEQRGGDIKFRVESIPGAPAAIIADSRNDENVILSQLHVAMLRFHNAVTDRLRARPENQGMQPRELFRQARRLVQWHYQWIIVNEFLPLTIGQDRLDAILREGPKFFDTGSGGRGGNERDRNERDGADSAGARDANSGRGSGPRIPVEFSVAAYRFGHSQVRPSYRLNFGPTGGEPFFAFVFDDSVAPTHPDPADLRGGKRAPRRFVDWQTFFDFGDSNVRPNKLIDTKISSPLMELPGARAPSPGLPSDGVQSLPSRNLIRHVNFGLPSGQAIARHIGVTALTSAQLAELAPLNLAESTPLWYYVLKEAEVMEGGARLGPVGARIVGDVFVGLLRADRQSYLAAAPTWKPTLPAAGGAGTFRMTDLLRLAGVVPPLQ
jgi:Animal haem peroxidase